MTHTPLRLNDTALTARLLPLVEGRVFHVSRLESLPAILASGAIVPTGTPTTSSMFGPSKHGYFQNRGC